MTTLAAPTEEQIQKEMWLASSVEDDIMMVIDRAYGKLPSEVRAEAESTALDAIRRHYSFDQRNDEDLRRQTTLIRHIGNEILVLLDHKDDYDRSDLREAASVIALDLIRHSYQVDDAGTITLRGLKQQAVAA